MVGIFKGEQLEEEAVKRKEISCLLFVDETLIFYQPLEDQIKYMSWIIMWFQKNIGFNSKCA